MDSGVSTIHSLRTSRTFPLVLIFTVEFIEELGK